MKILQYAFTGLLGGLILALLASRSIWLEMRVNTGILLPLTIACAVASRSLFRRDLPFRAVCGLEALLIFLLLAFYRFDPRALLLMPASLFKEGFFLHAVSIRTVNGILSLLVISGNGLFIPGPAAVRHWHRRQNAFEPEADRPDPFL